MLIVSALNVRGEGQVYEPHNIVLEGTGSSSVVCTTLTENCN